MPQAIPPPMAVLMLALSTEFLLATLISEDVAKRMGELGNITPAVSVEGFEK